MRCKLNFKKYTIQNATEENKEENYEDDYVAKSIGAFGLWQLQYIIILSLTRTVSVFNTLSVLFLAPATNFVCETFKENVDIDVRNDTCYDNCAKYKYAKNVFDKTFVTEFNLICDDSWKASFSQTVMMFGVLCGASFYGWFSDRFGRSKTMIVCGVNCVIFMFAGVLCQSYWTLIAMRFCGGCGSGGIFVLSPVYCSEIVGAKFIQTVLTVILPVSDAFGLLIMSAIAYLTASWRTFTVVYSSITVLVITLILFLPETPRWLIAKNRVTEAVDLMTKAVKLNGMDASNITENVAKTAEQIKQKEDKELHLTYFDLFRTKKLAIWTIACFALWTCTGFSYYGLLQYISQFGSNVYFVVCLLGFLHVVSSPLTLIILKYFGRKTTSIYSLIIITVISIILIFTRKESMAAIILGGIGVLVVCILFTAIYIICIELYPTPMRNMGMSVSSVGSKTAAMVAPFVVNMTSHSVAASVFAAVSVIAALLCLLIPETKGKTLKDTIDDD